MCAYDIEREGRRMEERERGEEIEVREDKCVSGRNKRMQQPIGSHATLN